MKSSCNGETKMGIGQDIHSHQMQGEPKSKRALGAEGTRTKASDLMLAELQAAQKEEEEEEDEVGLLLSNRSEENRGV